MGRTREAKAHHDSRRWLKHRPPRRSDPLQWLPPPRVWQRRAEQTIDDYPTLVREMDRLIMERAYRSGRVGPSAEQVLTGGDMGRMSARLEAVEWARRHLARVKPSDKRKREVFHRAVAYGLGFRGGGPDG